MKPEFWIEKWQSNQIGFHQNDFNRLLVKYWPSLNIPTDSTVLVPLCGKSKDMLWLVETGCRVIGSELSEKAIEDFINENHLEAAKSENPPFTVYESNRIKIYVGNNFSLQQHHLAGISAVYDRAALVALPEQTRLQYVQHQLSLLPRGCTILLVSLEYDPKLVNPPPFDIYQKDVEKLYENKCDIEFLETLPAKIKGENGFESVYRLTVH